MAQVFDPNSFKRSVKDWMRTHPDGSLQDLIDFCEEQIPSTQFAAYQWLMDQTVSWYRHILAHRDSMHDPNADNDSDDLSA